jgi:hypothetical protein
VLGRDEVQQGHPLDVLEQLEAEDLQVGRVGPDVHAFVDVGDGIARGVDQRVATAFGLADLGLEPAQGAAGFQVGPFGADRALDMVHVLAQHHASGAQLHRLQQAAVVELVDQHQHGQVLAGRVDDLHHLFQWHGVRRARSQHEIGQLLRDQRPQVVLAFGSRRPHRNAAVAQSADDGLGRLDTVVDDHQAQRRVFAELHSSPLPGVFMTRSTRSRPRNAA